jgi:hypothetical protein
MTFKTFLRDQAPSFLAKEVLFWPKFIYRDTLEAYILLGERVSARCFDARWYYRWSKESNLYTIHLVFVDKYNAVVKEGLGIYLKEEPNKTDESFNEMKFMMQIMKNATEEQFVTNSFGKKLNYEFWKPQNQFFSAKENN